MSTGMDSEYMQDPQGRVRFYGIYEGIVKEINDPLKKGRIKVQVTVTGQEVTDYPKHVHNRFSRRFSDCPSVDRGSKSRGWYP
jgi:hypothetical protein